MKVIRKTKRHEIDSNIWGREIKLKKFPILTEARSGIGDVPKTIVVVSSITFDDNDLKDIVGIVHYEARGLWEILKAQDENTKIIYITSTKIDDEAIDHLLSFSNCAQAIKENVTFLSLDNSNPHISLTEKILLDESFIKLLKSKIGGQNAYLQSFVSSKAEHELSKKLSIKLYGPHPSLSYFFGKSGNRTIFDAANVICTPGVKDIKHASGIKHAILKLWRENPEVKKMVVKLDQGVSGKGNAVLKLPFHFSKLDGMAFDEINDLLDSMLIGMKFQGRCSWNSFKKRLYKGAIVELFIEGENKTSPSGQGLVHSNGEVEVLATHEQVLDESGQVYLGSFFPANSETRDEICKIVKRVGESLSFYGIIGMYSVDFLYTPENPDQKLWPIEINVRRGGTTHSYQTAKLLTNSIFDQEKGLLVSEKGNNVYYKSNDNIVFDSLKGVNINEFLGAMKEEGVLFSSNLEKGVIFHMLGALKECGKVGLTAVGRNKEETACLDRAVMEIIRNRF